MKIAIVSDTHDNLANVKKALGWIRKENIKVLLHCGDVCTSSTLREIMKDFAGKVFVVFGNVDGDYYRKTKPSFKEFSNLKVFPELGEIEFRGKKIAFCHLPDFAKALSKTKNYDLVFYGHSHKPWEEKIGTCRLVNPGNLANLFYKATFAVYDTENDKLELKVLEKL